MQNDKCKMLVSGSAGRIEIVAKRHIHSAFYILHSALTPVKGGYKKSRRESFGT